MEVFGYIAAVLIGISLGLIGGGGSILTVPVLVYLFKIDATTATAYSLFIVGATSLVGAIKNYRDGNADIRTALLFGISSITTVFITRRLIVPAIPSVLWENEVITITKSAATMILFAILMVLASVSMIRSRTIKKEAVKQSQARVVLQLLLYGIGIGLVTGLLGAGGGFLLIPALVLMLDLPMKKAIGTSLLIIALNSLIGFTGDIGHLEADWQLLIILTIISIAGILVGGRIGRHIPGPQLKKGFGWFVLIMGVYILINESLPK